MNNLDKNKIIKMVVILAAIVVIAGGLSRLATGNSMSLTDYVAQNASSTPAAPAASVSPAPEATLSPTDTSVLIGASLNGSSQLSQRTTYTDGFYFEPVSDKLRRYMTGVSYPSDVRADTQGNGSESRSGSNGAAAADVLPVISFEELRYVHIWHYDFSGNPVEGELICNEYVAQDIVEIFYELYRNEYKLEKVLLVDEYDGDTNAALEDNNTCCFHCNLAEGDSDVSKHAYGLAIDINPSYNPYVVYEKDGTEKIYPAAALDYADRSKSFAYKIDENDLCYKLFVRHGFIWGGNRNDGKAYMHFQKAKP